MRGKKVRAGSKDKLSAGTWNGFVDMYRDYKLGNATNGPLPELLRSSSISQAVLQEGQDPIPPFTPVKIVKPINNKQVVLGVPVFEVKAAEYEVDDHYSIGFTLSEGVGSDNGGRIVISGMAIVQMKRHQLYDDLVDVNNPLADEDTGRPHKGSWDSTWYSPPDESLIVNPENLVGQIGRFKLLSSWDPQDLENEYDSSDDTVFVAINVDSHPGKVIVNITERLDPAEGSVIDITGNPLVRTMSRGEVFPILPTKSTETGKKTAEPSYNYGIYIYNPWKTTSDLGVRTASWSPQFNCLVLDQPPETRYGLADSTIAHGTVGTVEVLKFYLGSGNYSFHSPKQTINAQYNLFHMNEDISAGKEVKMEWNQAGEHWQITGAECE